MNAVDIVYTEFISSVNQQATVQRILHCRVRKVEVSENIREAEFGTKCRRGARAVTYRLVEAQVHHARQADRPRQRINTSCVCWP